MKTPTLLLVALLIFGGEACGQNKGWEDHRRLASGYTVLPETYVSSDRHAWKISGGGPVGVLARSAWSRNLRGGATVIAWGGDREGTMIQARGAFGRISDLTLVGWPSLPPEYTPWPPTVRVPRPGCRVGIDINHRGAFNGFKGIVDNVSLAGFESAIRIGRPHAPGNDNATFRNLHLARNRWGVHLDGAQSMGHVFDVVHARFNESVFYVQGGGNCLINSSEIGPNDTLLTFDMREKQLGPNNMHWTFNSVRVDGGRGMVTLVDERADSAVDVVINRLIMPVTPGAGMRVRLRGGDSRAVITDASNVPANTRFELNGATLTLVRCRLIGEPKEWVIGGGTLRLRDCVVGGEFIESRTLQGENQEG